MSPLAVLLLCLQACLIRNAMAACFGAGPYTAGMAAPCGMAGAYGIGAPFAAPLGAIGPFATPMGAIGEPFGYAGLAEYGVAGCGARYGGSGIGNVAVAGELPVGGATAVAGQVPIIGAVEYAGPVAAAGAVTIAGNCACGCGNPGYGYGYGIY